MPELLSVGRAIEQVWEDGIVSVPGPRREIQIRERPGRLEFEFI